MAAEFVATLISLGIRLFPSLGAYAFSSFFSDNSDARKRHAAEEDPENLFQTVELIQDTLYDAEQMEIKDHSFKLWLKELRDIAREAEDLLHKYRYVARCVRTNTRHMQQNIVPLPDATLVWLNQLRSRFEEIERERQYLRFSESDEEGHVADKKHGVYLQGARDEHWDIIELQAGNAEDWDINLFNWSESDEKGDIGDEEEIEDQQVLQETESDEVECAAEESEIIECEADLQLSKRDELEVGYPSEETEIKKDKAPQLTKCDEVGHAAENRDIRDLSEIKRVAYNAEDVHITYQNETTPVHVEPLQLNSNLSRERSPVISDGTVEHFKRLKSYAKGSTACITALGISIFMSTLKEQGNAIFVNATYICLVSCFIQNFIVMLFSEGTQTLSRNCFPRQQQDHLHIFIYGSTFIKMLCGLFPLLASQVKYGPLAIFPVLALIIMICLFVRGCKFGHTQSATNYREHDGKLKYYSKFYSAVTIATFSGLSVIIFSSPTTQQNEVKPTEIFLYIAVSTSILLMQLTSVPPAVSHQTMRERVMEAMRYLFSTMVGLLFLVALLAVGAVLRGVISILIYIAGFVSFIVVVVLNERKVQLRARNEPTEEDKLDSLAMEFVGFTFTVLMVVYSKYVDDRTKVHNQYFLLLGCMVCLCTSFLTSLSKALLVSGTTSKAWPRAKMISSFISYALAFVAVIFSYLLYRGQ